MTRRRHQVPPQPIAWFRNLLECMGDRFRICLASKDDEPVAGIVLLRHRDTLVYKYGASDARFHSLGAMPFLFWNAIREAKASGIRWLDLGRSDSDNAGLITFKDRLGADRSTLTYVRYPAPADVTSRPVPARAHGEAGARLSAGPVAGRHRQIVVPAHRLNARGLPCAGEISG